MSPADLKAARRALGLSQAELARAVRVATDRTVRKWEDAERDIPGPVIELVRIWTDPRCPAWARPWTSQRKG